MSAHPWRLVAPWYRWPAQGVPIAQTGRTTRPVLQKYAGPRFVDDLLQQPQRSLTFGPEDRWTYAAELPPEPVGRRRRVADHRIVETPTKKLFLPMHGRFYVAVCALHCDVTGFPPADRSGVASAGLVVRRRVVRSTSGATVAPAEVLQRLAAARAALADVPIPTGDGPLELTSGPTWSEHHSTRRAAAGELRVAQAELADWADTAGVTFELEGWHAGGDDGIGWWGPVAEEPESLGDEVVHPLLPLRAPAGDPRHDAADACLFFGNVPTGSPELTSDGAPRFDDEHVYEIRCFVEQQHPCRPGPLTWSAPTDRYLLAAPHDVIGTSLRPTTVTMPSVPKVLADAAAQPPGRGGLLVRTPAGAPVLGGSGPALATASRTTALALPLVTIIAAFVLNAFLRVVVVRRRLWGLLASGGSLPPGTPATIALDAELAALGGVDLDTELDPVTGQVLDRLLLQELEASVGRYVATEMVASQTRASLLELRHRLQVDVEGPGSAVDLTADLRHEPYVDRSQVVLR